MLPFNVVVCFPEEIRFVIIDMLQISGVVFLDFVLNYKQLKQLLLIGKDPLVLVAHQLKICW